MELFNKDRGSVYIFSFASGMEGRSSRHIPRKEPSRGFTRLIWTMPGYRLHAFPSTPICTPSLGRLSGSYEDLQRGQVSEALVDFTGGVTMTFNLAEAPGNLWDILTRATYNRTLIGCQTHSGVRLGCVPAQCPLLLPSPSSASFCSHLAWSPRPPTSSRSWSPGVQT